jgi:alanine dehydrogenase
MATLVLDHRTVRDLLTYPECIERMADALRALSVGEAEQPVRSTFHLGSRTGFLGLMPAGSTNPPALGIKVLSMFPQNSGTGRPAHQGVVVLFDPDLGEPIAIVDAASLTEIRTAAVSALATRVLAREDASVLAILGTGAQAAAHAHAVSHVRHIRRLILWGRNRARARSLAQGLAGLDPTVEVADDVETALGAADILCTTTASREPIVPGEWVRPGTHVNAIGATALGSRELSTSLVVRSRVYVDQREAAWTEADDLRIPLAERAIDRDHVRGELGELLLGRADGRRTGEEITLFKSVGLAVEDLAAARYLYERATAEGRGDRIALSPTTMDGTSLRSRPDVPASPHP